jgi:hypothetical protein
MPEAGSVGTPRIAPDLILTQPGAALLVSVGLWAAGCGASASSVSGKVTYKGQLVKGGTVTFFGADNWTSSCRIGEDGTYTILKVPPGQVKITVETQTAKPNPMASRMPKPPKDTPMPEGSMYTTQGQADRDVPIPEQYADKERSGLTYEEKKGDKQVHNIELD